LLGLVAEDQAR